MTGSAARPLVGVDLGGTAIKAGAVARDGTILARRELPAGVERGAPAVADDLAALARELFDAHGCEPALGLGVPGLLDRAAGAIVASPNLAAMDGFPLREELARRLELDEGRVAIENDANVAALGEHRYGAARGLRDVLLVTLGTGVGGGLILGGALHVGAGMAGEVGHLVVDPRGPLCGCGTHGCLETLASATAARRRAREAGLTPDLRELAARARDADGPERALLREVGRDLGRGLGMVVTLLDLRDVLVGGGFGAALDVLRPGILDGALERCYGRTRADLHVRPAALGPDAGWIGAAALNAAPVRSGGARPVEGARPDFPRPPLE